jgi:hypothetical protein
MYSTREPIYQDPTIYNLMARNIEGLFYKEVHKLQKVKELAQRIKKGIEEISPFIQQSTETVCPRCTDVCCINKHGYYNYEDLVYINALGLRPPDYDFEKRDSTPCQFLSEKGCVMDRSVRPSGCNWYFCESLFDYMEGRPEYATFDNNLRDIAELWMELMDEFNRLVKGMESAE